jgi:hypothetical protein
MAHRSIRSTKPRRSKKPGTLATLTPEESGEVNAETKRWFEEAERRGAAYLLIVQDGFDGATFHVICQTGADYQARVAVIEGDRMARLIGIYEIAKGWGLGLSQ